MLSTYPVDRQSAYLRAALFYLPANPPIHFLFVLYLFVRCHSVCLPICENCLYFHLSAYRSICLVSIHLSIDLPIPIHLSIYSPTNLLFHLCSQLALYQYIQVYLYISIEFVLSTHPQNCVSADLLIYGFSFTASWLFICLSICPSIASATSSYPETQSR